MSFASSVEKRKSKWGILVVKKVTGFSNTEEEAVGLTNVVPFFIRRCLES
jgi:hypothetical protein